MLWVTNSTVIPVASQIRSNAAFISSRVIWSSAPNGSSISSTSGSWIRARASATRWRWPPESWCGRRSAQVVQAHPSQQLPGAAPDPTRPARRQAPAAAPRCAPPPPREQCRLLEDHADACERVRARRGGGTRDRQVARHPPAAGRRPAGAAWICRSRMGQSARRTLPGATERLISCKARAPFG